MEKVIQQIIKGAKEKESHASHSLVIKEVFYKLKKVYLSLDIEAGEGIQYQIQRVQLRVLLNALTKMVESIITLLDSKIYDGIDPLARVVMEHAINVIYLAESKKNERSKQLIKHYIETTIEKSRHWYNSAKNRGDKAASDLAMKKINYLKELKKNHPGVYERSIGKWPNSFKRFEYLGYEDEYVTLYSMNSDSIHSLSEDVYNFCTVESYPPELQKHVIRNLRALNMSMSVYLAMKSVLFYALALDKISTLLKQKHDVSGIIKGLDEVALEHESEHSKRWS